MPAGARQLVTHTRTTCDAKASDHEGCLGFDQFSNTQLKRLCRQVFNADDEIADW